MPLKYWMITNRNVEDSSLGSKISALSFWTSEGSGDIRDLNSWSKAASMERFKKMLMLETDQFPVYEDWEHENQKHLALFVHGFDNDWPTAVTRYELIRKNLFDGDSSMGICVLFTWPSNGHVYEYLPDRQDAEKSGPYLASVLCELYDWLLDKQVDAADDPKKACKAKTSIIAHSMGNFVLQKAMQAAWTRNNRPQLVSLINQAIMVAADVDNDLFKSGEVIGDGDGDAIASLCYRVSSLYSGRDSVLGLSAGLKHFGQRRLGRSGLHPDYTPPSNVWQYDCSKLIAPDEKNVHSAYFNDQSSVYDLIRQILRGTDRNYISVNS